MCCFDLWVKTILLLSLFNTIIIIIIIIIKINIIILLKIAVKVTSY